MPRPSRGSPRDRSCNPDWRWSLLLPAWRRSVCIALRGSVYRAPEGVLSNLQNTPYVFSCLWPLHASMVRSPRRALPAIGRRLHAAAHAPTEPGRCPLHSGCSRIPLLVALPDDHAARRLFGGPQLPVSPRALPYFADDAQQVRNAPTRSWPRWRIVFLWRKARMPVHEVQQHPSPGAAGTVTQTKPPGAPTPGVSHSGFPFALRATPYQPLCPRPGACPIC